VPIKLTTCIERAVILKLANPKRLGREKISIGIVLATRCHHKRGEGSIMKFRHTSSIRKKQAYWVALIGLGFTGCATVSSDLNYADRNNIDSARAPVR
jgi:hypothetical protein